ncbi:MAG: CARDB domain-containing protein [Candidatus ainarchaeum sp.]|nr:CARDB domain-containing protein [Candidatus ainarchaeum sp.]
MNNKILIIIFLILFSFGVLAAPPEITQVTYTPSPAIPGSTITLFIQLENNEEISQNNVTVEIENKYPFEVKEKQKKEIGGIIKFGKALTYFEIYVDPSAENMTYTIPITITSKEQPIGKTINKEIIVSGQEPLIKVIEISSQKLVPGQEKKIEFSVKNLGTSTAYDIIIELKEDRTIVASGVIIEREITPLGSAIAYIEKLEPKQEETKIITVSVNREAILKNYTLPVTISYMNNVGERSEETTNIGFKVSGEVDLDLILREKIELIAGQTHEISFELFNKGAGKSEFTIINLETEIGIVEKTKQFIGSLAPNDVDSFKTNIIVNQEIKTQNTIIKATIEYQDTDATTKTKIIEIPIQTYSMQDWNEKQGTNPFGIIIIIIILIIIIAWKISKKIKKKN